jgi:hypothetical protein
MAHTMRQPRQRIVERQARVAAQPEENLDPMGFQHFHGCFRAGE